MAKKTKAGKFDERKKGAKEANIIWDLMVLAFELAALVIMSTFQVLLLVFEYLWKGCRFSYNYLLSRRKKSLGENEEGSDTEQKKIKT